MGVCPNALATAKIAWIWLMSFHEDARMALVVGPILLGLYLLLYFLLGLGKKEKLQLGEQK